MSEYQRYEFQAVERPLTAREVAEVRKTSTRAEITSTRFFNEYHWGDFKGNPATMVKKYFDVFAYVANWGTHWCILRIPKSVMPLATAKLFRARDEFGVVATEKHLLFEFQSDDEGGDWEGGQDDGWMGSLVALRGEIIAGDLRGLYLAWLAAMQWSDLDDVDLEPPVPAGLARLTAPQRALADFLRIDDDVLACAAAASEKAPMTSAKAKDVREWVVARPQKEKDEALAEMIAGEDRQLADKLRRRFQAEWSKKHSKLGSNSETDRRSIGAILSNVKRSHRSA